MTTTSSRARVAAVAAVALVGGLLAQTAPASAADSEFDPDFDEWQYAAVNIDLRTPTSGASAGAILDVNMSTATEIVGTKPSLQGTPKILRPVHVDVGAWEPAGVVLTYQWLLNGKRIPGATKAAYTPRVRDYGKQLSVRVTGSLPGVDPVTFKSAPKRIRLL
jgi:hypothetical protein